MKQNLKCFRLTLSKICTKIWKVVSILQICNLFYWLTNFINLFSVWSTCTRLPDLWIQVPKETSFLDFYEKTIIQSHRPTQHIGLLVVVELSLQHPITFNSLTNVLVDGFRSCLWNFRVGSFNVGNYIVLPSTYHYLQFFWSLILTVVH